jgi:thiol-disulfide isomerase/thioredoxin
MRLCPRSAGVPSALAWGGVLLLALPPAGCSRFPGGPPPPVRQQAAAEVAAKPPPPGPKIGEAAPEIEGPDLEGKPFKLSDYRGKVVFLQFWASW